MSPLKSLASPVLRGPSKTKDAVRQLASGKGGSSGKVSAKEVPLKDGSASQQSARKRALGGGTRDQVSADKKGSAAKKGADGKSPAGRSPAGSGTAGKVAAFPRKPPRQPADVDMVTEVRVNVGDSAPSFVLKDDSQSIVSSESFRGAPYVLYFYPKDDTPGCTLEACGFRDLMSRFSAKGVKVVGVSADTPEAHTRFKKKYSLNFPLLSDPEKTLAKAYGVWVLKKQYGREYMGIERSTFVIDRHGHIKHVFRGVRVPGHVEAVLDLV